MVRVCAPLSVRVVTGALQLRAAGLIFLSHLKCSGNSEISDVDQN